MRGQALVICELALQRGMIPAERQAKVRALMESFPPDQTQPAILVDHGVLTREQLDLLLAESQESGQAPTLALDGAAAPGPDRQGGLPRAFGDDYELLELVGQGAMGYVYRARQRSLGRDVALKVVKAPDAQREGLLQRFQIEARAAARLRHPNIVAVHEVGAHEGVSFFSMDLVRGSSLREVIRGGQLSVTQSLALLEKVACAVHHAHQQGVIHRDLKPGNILVDSDGEPYVTDFGLAKDLRSEITLSATGTAVGTPAYMSPEQAQGRSRHVDARSDVYALGAVLYEMLTRKPPFEADSVPALLAKIVGETPEPPRRLNAAVPAEVQTICLKCLAKKPERRYQSAAELADDITRFLGGEPIQARPSSIWYRTSKRLLRHKALAAVATLAVALAAVLIAVLVQPPADPASVQVLDDTCVQALDEAGGKVWHKDMGTRVAAAVLTSDLRGRTRVVVGLRGEGELAGHVVVFDARGRELWRFAGGDTSPYPHLGQAVTFVNGMAVGDILPEPGNEIVAVFACRWYPSRVCILSEEGALLREMWHPGRINGVTRIGTTSRLVFRGANNFIEEPKSKRDAGRHMLYTHAIFCVEADKLGGQCPPHIAPGIPRADLLWYKMLHPQGSRCREPIATEMAPGSGELRLKVWTTRFWLLYVDLAGTVVGRAAADHHETPACDLIEPIPERFREPPRPNAAE